MDSPSWARMSQNQFCCQPSFRGRWRDCLVPRDPARSGPAQRQDGARARRTPFGARTRMNMVARGGVRGSEGKGGRR
jgi:hypothetical protein